MISKKLFKRLNEFKQRIQVKKEYDFETQLLNNDTFNYLDRDKLLYAHTLMHYLFVQRFPLNNREWTKERLSSVHNALVIEMNTRNLTHFEIDKLDR